ncbi:MAG: TRAM domain-containing protein [Candidatus Eremiobacteraeota bacterium]|nr:TRAM domain-containing protein [Candidatus Eremiobacteraeota bacterium]
MRGVRNVRVGGPLAGTVLRGIFAIVFAVTGFLLGREAYLNIFALHFASDALQWSFLILSPVVGALIGLLLAPLAQSLFEGELMIVETAIERLAPSELAGGAVGLIVGLVIALLLKSIVFEFIPVAVVGKSGSYLAIVIYIIVSIFAAYLGARVGAKTRIVPVSGGAVSVAGGGAPKIIDTSVIVDGRIVEIVAAGFLEAPLVVPRFVLRELQAIADSLDSMKRTRGRRGLEVLNRLTELTRIDISERDYDDLPPGSVDAKLVRLAQECDGRLVTNDYNLNRVASVEGVVVLNINELANAVKPVLQPGDEMHVQVMREGKEPHQGVGYMEDGTMIVVEQGRKLIGDAAEVVVTSVLQTVAGRMIFARLKKETNVS